MNQKVSPWVVAIVIIVVVAVVGLFLMKHGGPSSNPTDIENAIKQTTVSGTKGALPGGAKAPAAAPTAAPVTK